MAKIERKFMAHFINAAELSASEPAYTRLGEGLEEYTVEMGATVEKKNDINGNTSVLLSAYEKSSSVEPYIAEKGDAIFTRLQDIIDNSRVLDECATDVVEVKLWETETSGSYPATKEKVIIEVVSYGGNTNGYQIPFNLHYTGEKTTGTFNPTTKTFTAKP